MTTMTRSVRLRREEVTRLANIDWALVVLNVAIVALGITAIYSATRAGDTTLPTKQVLFFGVGFVLMFAMAMVDYAVLRPLLPVIGAATVVVLIAVLTPLGSEVKGTQGWFIVGPFSLQPAEFTKLSLIILLSALFTGRSGNIEAPRITASLGILGLFALLVLAEGETGSVLVYCSIALGIYLVAGMPARYLLLLVLSAIGVFAVILDSSILADYQRDRLTSFLGQGDRYHLEQSVNAIGSGGLTGQGLLEGPQTQFGFVPEPETDFIFTVIGEELGLVGTSAVLILEALILIRIFRIAQLARDGFGTLLCIGVFSMLLVHVVQNVGMTLSLAPITGIPLPFVSYGGSALLTAMLAMGLVQSVAVHRHRNLH